MISGVSDGRSAHGADEYRRLRQRLVLAMCALTIISGCSRPAQEDVQLDDAPPLYDPVEYDRAEGAVAAQVRNRLAEMGVEYRDLWLGLRPMPEGPPGLDADLDAYCDPDQGQELSQIVAEVALNALPRHETVRVRVYWWRERAGDDYAHLTGAWVWDASGELIRHTPPEDLVGR